MFFFLNHYFKGQRKSILKSDYAGTWIIPFFTVSPLSAPGPFTSTSLCTPDQAALLFITLDCFVYLGRAHWSRRAASLTSLLFPAATKNNPPKKQSLLGHPALQGVICRASLFYRGSGRIAWCLQALNGSKPESARFGKRQCASQHCPAAKSASCRRWEGKQAVFGSVTAMAVMSAVCHMQL